MNGSVDEENGDEIDALAVDGTQKACNDALSGARDDIKGEQRLRFDCRDRVSSRLLRSVKADRANESETLGVELAVSEEFRRSARKEEVNCICSLDPFVIRRISGVSARCRRVTLKVTFSVAVCGVVKQQSE